jgi:hypothetical protein
MACNRISSPSCCLCWRSMDSIRHTCSSPSPSYESTQESSRFRHRPGRHDRARRHGEETWRRANANEAGCASCRAARRLGPHDRRRDSPIAIRSNYAFDTPKERHNWNAAYVLETIACARTPSPTPSSPWTARSGRARPASWARPSTDRTACAKPSCACKASGPMASAPSCCPTSAPTCPPARRARCSASPVRSSRPRARAPRATTPSPWARAWCATETWISPWWAASRCRWCRKSCSASPT